MGSLVNTITQFDQIERVKILVEGNEFIGPSGNPRGFMEPFTAESKFPEETRNVVLYFANEDASAVVGEKVNVQVLPNMKEEDFIKLVLERLIEGPQSKELYSTIPQEVKVKTVAINDKIANVDFSEEMHTRHWRGAAGESMTINSIVNTLTEFDYIEMVQMMVEGNLWPLNMKF